MTVRQSEHERDLYTCFDILFSSWNLSILLLTLAKRLDRSETSGGTLAFLRFDGINGAVRRGVLADAGARHL